MRRLMRRRQPSQALSIQRKRRMDRIRSPLQRFQRQPGKAAAQPLMLASRSMYKMAAALRQASMFSICQLRRLIHRRQSRLMHF
jgi:arginine/lysine/ornithine decarboxylase